MTAQRGLQKTSSIVVGTRMEDGGQKKLDNSPGQALKASYLGKWRF